MLRKCKNHRFKDIVKLSIFRNDFKFDTKMLLDAPVSGIMMIVDMEQTMIVDMEQTIKIIDALTSIL